GVESQIVSEYNSFEAAGATTADWGAHSISIQGGTQFFDSGSQFSTDGTTVVAGITLNQLAQTAWQAANKTGSISIVNWIPSTSGYSYTVGGKTFSAVKSAVVAGAGVGKLSVAYTGATGTL
ncbi:hypothetical protein HDU93_006577, partial [Gonapodya sp. JEL0774]